MIFLLYPIDVIDYIKLNIEAAFLTWDKPHLLVVYDPFNVLWNLVCQYFVEDFCIYFCSSGIFACNSLFL